MELNKILKILSLSIPYFLSHSIFLQQKNKVYIWGNGYYQPRPQRPIEFNNLEPKLITTLTPYSFQSIIFGQYHQAGLFNLSGIDSKGNLYVWDKQILPSSKEQLIDDSSRKNIIKLNFKNVKLAAFTKGYLWGLSSKGQLMQWEIESKDENGKKVIKQKGRQIPIKKIKSIATGYDHILILNDKGQVFSMGDDTYGQCGIKDDKRFTFPPFTQARIKTPTKIVFISNKMQLPQVVKIACGGEHSLAISKQGNLYGWGSNSKIQISQQEQFSKYQSPLLCSYIPIGIHKNLKNNKVIDIAAGDQFTIVVTQNIKTKQTQGKNGLLVFSCGINLNGQLGIKQLKHVNDINKIQNLSNYTIKKDKQVQNIKVQKISCGKNHCMALLNINVVMEWGANEFGQMGNKKRIICTCPVIMKYFNKKKVINICCGHNSSAVIVQQQ